MSASKRTGIAASAGVGDCHRSVCGPVATGWPADGIGDRLGLDVQRQQSDRASHRVDFESGDLCTDLLSLLPRGGLVVGAVAGRLRMVAAISRSARRAVALRVLLAINF